MTTPGSFVRIDYTKWPSHPHYSYRMRVLGEDDLGVWGCCDIGEQVHKGGKPYFVRPASLLLLIPRVGSWSASWYPPSEERREVYVDINTTPLWTADAVTMVDVDFDVLRYRDGTVELLDEDEFEEHQLGYGYPDDLVSFARDAAHETLALALGPFEPFDQAWRAWYAQVHELR
jgi:uncharacterized protein